MLSPEMMLEVTTQEHNQRYQFQMKTRQSPRHEEPDVPEFLGAWFSSL
jgi:hypothetical protein